MARLTPVEKKVKWCNLDWALNPHARTQTWPKSSLPTEITHLVSGLSEAQVLDVSLHTEFSDRQTSLERNTPYTVCGPSQKARVASKYGVNKFLWAG